MSAQPVTGFVEEPDLSNLTPSRKEDFLLFAETPPCAQPDQLTLRQVRALSEEARADRARRLRVWHGARLPGGLDGVIGAGPGPSAAGLLPGGEHVLAEPGCCAARRQGRVGSRSLR